VQSPTVPSQQTDTRQSQLKPADTIGESPAAYSTATVDKLLAEGLKSATNNILFQRYLITQTDNKAWLIDLQQAELNHRHKQFKQAVAKKALSSRPILVPVKIHLESKYLDIMLQSQKRLTEFGFQFTHSEGLLIIKAIPSLFSSADLIQLITNIALDISPDMTMVQLSKRLIKHLPISKITNQEQAQVILNQISPEDLESSWCYELNEDSFNRLFSSRPS
jgi:DNA mismatch repair ATPase MutL